MKRNSPPVRKQPHENVTSNPAVDVMNLISFIVRSGRRGDRAQVQILSLRFLSKRMFSVYVLRSSKTGRRYVGSCAHLSDRLRRHNAGESRAPNMVYPGL
jgi:GIY-YIG catalytic domain